MKIVEVEFDIVECENSSKVKVTGRKNQLEELFKVLMERYEIPVLIITDGRRYYIPLLDLCVTTW
ncbi:MAG: hypothetical protein DRJ47_11010 [Thermoprotei archaeon]|nr:MAG: hypothetical protein DRJ47_11010 [Thermoprotei archaeon]